MADVLCKKCGKSVPSGSVRFVSSEAYYCDSCFKGVTGRSRGVVPSSRDYDASPVRKESLVCGKCGFRSKFREDSSAPRICGYCGGSDFDSAKDSAAHLIAESSDFDTQE